MPVVTDILVNYALTTEDPKCVSFDVEVLLPPDNVIILFDSTIIIFLINKHTNLIC